jgi:hypothetical protein
MAELLARSPKGILYKRDEFSGFVGSLEKYGGKSGSNSDRAFYLKAYDGGSYTRDRIVGGEIFVENLSISMLGGIQPDKLAELKGLTSDGLLQRFIRVMMRAPGLAQDPRRSTSTSSSALWLSCSRRFSGSATRRWR